MPIATPMAYVIEASMLKSRASSCSEHATTYAAGHRFYWFSVLGRADAAEICEFLEFSDAFGVLDHYRQRLTILDASLCPRGELGAKGPGPYRGAKRLFRHLKAGLPGECQLYNASAKQLKATPASCKVAAPPKTFRVQFGAQERGLLIAKAR